MGDKLGEAKSSGNLGNTLKVMGQYDEAMICCKRHLEISRELKDRVGIYFSMITFVVCMSLSRKHTNCMVKKKSLLSGDQVKRKFSPWIDFCLHYRLEGTRKLKNSIASKVHC